MKRTGYSPATRRLLWQVIAKDGPPNVSISSDASSVGSLRLRSVHQASASAFSPRLSFGNASSRRCLSTTPSYYDDDDTPPSSSSSKQIHVWEQTISSSAANAKGTTKEKMFSTKGRALYRSIIDNGSSNGWEMMPRSIAKADGDTSSSSSSSAPESSISSLINACKSKGDLTNIQNIPFIHHFLPARYPQSVCPSYGSYASYCFLGNVAGSSAMVLSTQALLVAVGVGTQSAAPMAAALNWVMKDGVGQLGGVIFASQLGKGGIDFDTVRDKIAKLTGPLQNQGVRDENNKNITATNTTTTTQQTKKKRGNFQRGTADSNPKRWRMVAALALDLSTFMEICTPMMGPEWFLPCASIANIGKNVGFLAASASRAAIHQSLSMGGSSSASSMTTAVPDGSDLREERDKTKSEVSSNKTSPPSSTTASTVSNLGDVTAKSGSQAIVASLAGTVIGIFLSRTFCSDYGTAGVLAGFVVLSAIHQVCTYKAVKVVPLRSLDRHRLHIVLTSYLHNFCKFGTKTDICLTPAQVAEKESFLPMMPPDESVRWLSVGSSLTYICPAGVIELEGLLLPMKEESTSPRNNASSHFDTRQHEKYILKVHPKSKSDKEGNDWVQLTFMEGATDDDLLRGMFHAYTAHEYMKSNTAGSDTKQIMLETHAAMSDQMPMFIDHLQEAGWQIGNGYVNVECGSSYRLKIQSI